MSKTMLTLGTSVLLVLAGCGKMDAFRPGKVSSSLQENPGKLNPSSEAAWNEKVQAYIVVSNRLVRFDDFAFQGEYAQRRRAEVDKGDFTAVIDGLGFIDETLLASLKEAIAKPAVLPAQDAAAKNVLAALEELKPTWSELVDYNKSRKFDDDGGARGRELLPKYRTGMDKLKSALLVFFQQTDVLSNQSHQKQLARFKAEGKLLEMHTVEAIGAAESIVKGFKTLEDLRNPGKIDAANARLAFLETSLQGMNREYQARKASASKSLPLIDQYETIYSKLNEMAGLYREARKDPVKFNDVTDRFNDAVEAYNMMTR